MKELFENIDIAYRSIRGQMLRTVLTILIIAFGIMALVGMLTAIDVLEQNINTSFQFLGSNTFVIQSSVNSGGRPQKRTRREAPPKVISYDEAIRFKERYTFPSTVSISAFATATGIIQYGKDKTQPNIPVSGGDENFILTGGYEIEMGRNFSQGELQTGADVVIIGEDIADGLFKGTNPVDKFVNIGTRRYMVIGVLKKSGSGINTGRDRTAIIPISNLRAYYAGPGTSYAINVIVPKAEMMDAAILEAEGVFRSIRGITASMKPNFEFERSDSVINSILSMTSTLAFGAIIIGMITLLGAVTGLVNIMLVSVNERTVEIGVRKALGAKRRSILIQFLAEAILICQVGGALGIVFGILNGNSLTFFMGGNFVIPWLWITIAVVLCFVVGIIAGVYPAIKASRLDPVEALRHE
ncbi:MAG: ABC transporter permease [Flavobacteriales bacterium]|nr:ABC transporter permease [Flavobacteriales bacterium]